MALLDGLPKKPAGSSLGSGDDAGIEGLDRRSRQGDSGDIFRSWVGPDRTSQLGRRFSRKS